MQTSKPFTFPPNQTRAERREHLKRCLKDPLGVVVIGFKDGTIYLKSPENNFRGVVPSAWLAKYVASTLYSSNCTMDVDASPTQCWYRSNWHPGIGDPWNVYDWTAETGFSKRRGMWARDDEELPGGMGVAFV